VYESTKSVQVQKQKQKRNGNSHKKMTSTIIVIKMTALMRPIQKKQHYQLSEPKVLFFLVLSQLLIFGQFLLFCFFTSFQLVYCSIPKVRVGSKRLDVLPGSRIALKLFCFFFITVVLITYQHNNSNVSVKTTS